MSRAAVGFVAAGALALLVGCGGGGAGRPDVYRTRGVVERVPQPGEPDQAIYIRHAPIPEYRDESGAVVGMGSMTMPFPLARGVSLAGLAAGDPVAFTFAVTWRPRAGYEITELRELPAGATVDLGEP